MVGIECNGAAFLTSFQEDPHQKSFFQGFFQNSANGKVYYSNIVYCLMLTGKPLAIHF